MFNRPPAHENHDSPPGSARTAHRSGCSIPASSKSRSPPSPPGYNPTPSTRPTRPEDQPSWSRMFDTLARLCRQTSAAHRPQSSPCGHQDQRHARASLLWFSLLAVNSAAGVGTSQKKNSKKRAPGALPPLGSNGGDRGAPGPTRQRALPHHRKTDLFADDRDKLPKGAVTPIVSSKGGGQRPVTN
jgi:hypothetical protein